MNCVTHCVSPSCHAEAKLDINPLEEGEVDEERAISFAQCVKSEIMREKARSRAVTKSNNNDKEITPIH